MDFSQRATKMDDNVEGSALQKKSPDMQRTSYNPRAMKTDDYDEGRARKVLARIG